MRRGLGAKIGKTKYFSIPSAPTTYGISGDIKIVKFRLKRAGSPFYRGANVFCLLRKKQKIWPQRSQRTQRYIIKHLSNLSFSVHSVLSVAKNREQQNRNSHQIQNSSPPRATARSPGASISPPPLRLHLPKNPANPRKIRNSGRRRLPPPQKIQMARPARRPNILRSPRYAPPIPRETKVNEDAPPDHGRTPAPNH